MGLFLIIIVPLLTNKILWLAGSEKTDGVFSFRGMGNALDQIRPTYSVLFFKHGKDTIWFHSPGNLDLKSGTAVPIRYQRKNPSDARVVTFMGIWGGTIIYGSILLLLVLLVIFLSKEILPSGSKIGFPNKNPLIRIKQAV